MGGSFDAGRRLRLLQNAVWAGWVAKDLDARYRRAMSTYTLPATGPQIATEADAVDMIGETYGTGADLIVIPVERLSPDFFKLSTGLAGAVLQKLTNYQFRVAIVGDLSAYTERSAPLRDFVRESNKRGAIRFVVSEADL